MTPITAPTLLVDKKRALENIRSMADKAKRNQAVFRPHFKTHQSRVIGRWFRDFGVDRITVSSVKMAEYFAVDHYKDITIAFPVNVLLTDKINKLASSITLNLVVESVESATILAKGLRHPVNVMIKIDAGYGRTGIPAGDTEKINEVITITEQYKTLSFKGFLSHSGHSYKATSHEEIAVVHEESKRANIVLRQVFSDRYPELIISVGDTPTCSVMEDFSWADELRPGNFIFFDVMQYHISSCSDEQIAVAMACPVVAVHPSRSELVIHGGGVHFSKDQDYLPNGEKFYGYAIAIGGSQFGRINPAVYLKSISQEHGIVRGPLKEISGYKVGDLIYIAPIHSCMCADLMGRYQTLEGEWIRS